MLANAESAATLIIGPDLKVRSHSLGWRKFGVSVRGRLTGKRINEIFPSSDLHGYVFDVLASGRPLTGVLVRVETAAGYRYLSANLQPSPANAEKPRRVVMRVVEMEGQLVADGDTGEILEINHTAAAALGASAESLLGKSIWAAEPLRSPEQRSSAFEALERRPYLHLGRFSHRHSGGEKVELEGALIWME